MKLKANCSFTGLRGTRAYNEVFEVPDEEGQLMLDEGYPVDVIDGPQAEQPAADGGAAEPEKEVPAEGAEGAAPSNPKEDEAQGQVDAEQPAADGGAAEPEKEGADGDRGSAEQRTSGGRQSAKGGRAKASKA